MVIKAPKPWFTCWVSQAVEVTPGEGDLLVFNPMCLHSPSPNTGKESRYVYFVSFLDSSAAYLRHHLQSTGYHHGFPDSLRDNLPHHLQTLLNW
jgi:hypothetical protein